MSVQVFYPIRRIYWIFLTELVIFTNLLKLVIQSSQTYELSCIDNSNTSMENMVKKMHSGRVRMIINNKNKNNAKNINEKNIRPTYSFLRRTLNTRQLNILDLVIVPPFSFTYKNKGTFAYEKQQQHTKTEQSNELDHNC